MHATLHATKVNQTLARCLDTIGNGLESDAVIERLLAILGGHYNGDRAFVFEFVRDTGVIVHAYEWCREGFETQIPILVGMNREDFAAWEDALDDKPAVFIEYDACDELPRSDEQRAILDQWELNSVLAAPLIVDGRLAGYLTVDNARDTDDIFIVLRTVAAYVSEDIAARESEGHRVVSAIRSTYVGMYLWDLERHTYREIQNGIPTWRSRKPDGSLDVIEESIRSVVDPAHWDLVRDFVNIDRIRQALRHKDSDSLQYLVVDVGWVLGRIIVMERAADGMPSKVVYTVEDIDQAKRQMELASYKAEHDVLTGLLNRTALERSLGDLEYDTRPVAIMMIDVDAFKSVNDRYGHGVGDTVLHGVGQAISHAMRSSDLVYRFGGDEFVVIARGCPASSQAELIHRVDLINISLEGRFAEVPSVKLSAGIAFGEDGSEGRALLSQADTALYRAKHSPIKCCVFDPELDG